MRTFAVRLQPGELLKEALEAHRARLGLEAGFVAAAVGSLDVVRLRLAGAGRVLERLGAHELLSLAGTLSPDGAHLHAAVADADGSVVGGHLLPGCRVYTTMEVVLGEADARFRREHDERTGFKELRILPAGQGT